MLKTIETQSEIRNAKVGRIIIYRAQFEIEISSSKTMSQQPFKSETIDSPHAQAVIFLTKMCQNFDFRIFLMKTKFFTGAKIKIYLARCICILTYHKVILTSKLQGKQVILKILVSQFQFRAI